MQPIEQHRAFHRAAVALKTAARIGGKLDIQGHVTLDSKRPVLLAANHRSLLDLCIALATVDQFGLSCRFLVRADLMERGPFAAFLHGIGCIPASRDTRESAEATAIETLRAGQLVGLMPEGGIPKRDQLVDRVGQPRPGLSRIALETNALVVPIAFSGTENVWPRDRAPRVQFPRPEVRVRIAQPMELPGEDHEENAAAVMAVISSMLDGR